MYFHATLLLVSQTYIQFNEREQSKQPPSTSGAIFKWNHIHLVFTKSDQYGCITLTLIQSRQSRVGKADQQSQSSIVLEMWTGRWCWLWVPIFNHAQMIRFDSLRNFGCKVVLLWVPVLAVGPNLRSCSNDPIR